MSMEREYRPIPGYESFYMVSDHGDVYSLRTSHALRPHRRVGGGYKHVVLTNADGVKRTHLVHRLVASAFLGPCPDGMECCHNDGDKANNTVANLRWDTHAANMADMRGRGVRERWPLGEWE